MVVGAGEHADQTGFAARFDWGLDGLRHLAPGVDVVVIVDVLRFTTAVTVAVERGAEVVPHPSADEGAAAIAADLGAALAGRREDGAWSLSPTHLQHLPVGTRLVLPSPDGAALAAAAGALGARRVLAGCWRNATAVGRAVAAGTVAVIAAGERWGDHDTGVLRPAWEDLVGAGLVLGAVVPESRSPEAEAAVATAPLATLARLEACASGRELVARGRADDVAMAAAVDATDVVAELVDGMFVLDRRL